MSTVFATAADAETAFYDAFMRRDIEAMMQVWDQSDDIVCIHPLGTRLTGVAAIRAAWASIFSHNPQFRFQLAERVVYADAQLAIHIVHEHILIESDAARRPPVIATNVYRHHNDGWRMVLHHASPSQTQQPRSAPEVLH